MLKNFFKTALRNLLRHKGFSLINIAGLSIGLACCLIIVFYVLDELSYDQFHEKADRIVRVTMEYGFGGQVGRTENTGTKVAPAFNRDFPEVAQTVRVYDQPAIVNYQDKLFEEKRFFYADSTFFHIFSFHMLKGDPAQVLDAPNQVVLTQSTARKYFGEEDPIGKIIQVNDEKDYLVTGIAEDVPINSQIKFDFMASFSSLDVSHTEEWFSASYKTYLLLNSQEAIASLQTKIPGYMEEQMRETSFYGQGFLTYDLEPLTKVHLYSELSGFEPNGDIRYIYIFSIIALLILVIACTNYMNLTTARAVERAKEVGVRKVLGAQKRELFWQFMGESVFIITIALVISVLLAELLLPFFNTLAERQLQIDLMGNPWLLSALLVTGLIVGLLAGSYPSLALSAFLPVKVLKGSFKTSGKGLWLRKTLIIFQFVISSFLTISTLVIQQQLNYIQDKKLGYDKEHVMVLPADDKIINHLSTFKSELKQNPDIQYVTVARESPIFIHGSYGIKELGAEQHNLITGIPVDIDFAKTLGLEFISGTDFTSTDEKLSLLPAGEVINAMILNEAAVKEMGWAPEEAIGKEVALSPRKGVIRGVVKNFHYAPFHESVGPLVIFLERLQGGVMMVKMAGENITETIQFVETKWKILAPHRPFEYDFLDSEYTQLYQAEQQIGKIFKTFAFLAILLACLGLFGLAAFTAQQRTKEIGIRKVLGASISSIVTLLSKDFVKLILIAFAIAAPMAGYAMHQWLEDYAYRVELSAGVFFIAGILALLIAFFAISWQSIKAALANPVESLRDE